MIRVLIVDDSALMRKNLRRLLQSDPEIVVVGAARDGADALLKYEELQPDIVTMDVNMPTMDGITALQHLLEADRKAKVLMLSSLTHEGAVVTFEALALGAIDFVEKPGGTVTVNMASVTRELIDKIKAIAKIRRGKRKAAEAVKQIRASSTKKLVGRSSKVVVIGVSTGGPKTLLDVVPKLPAGLKAPVLIVQHMPANFTSGFAERLNASSPLAFKEAAAGDILLPGHGYVAPGGMHMALTPMSNGDGHRIRITSHPSDSLYKPSVDVTMNSAFECFGKEMVGVILTGMGNDGAETMVKLHAAGGLTIAEHESTAIVYGMPREVVDRGAADLILPAPEIGEAIARAVGVQ